MPYRDPTHGEALLKEQLSAIYTASLDAIITFDRGGTILTANEGANEMFGYGPGELKGMRLLDLMPGEYREAEAAALERRGTSTMIELLDRIVKREGVRKDGEPVPFTAFVHLLTEIPPERYIVVAEDMTAVSKAHRRILQLHEEVMSTNRNLEALVQERTGQLESSIKAVAEANRQLALEVREREAITQTLQRREIQLERLLFRERELSELRSRFVSMASHEFRTPLTAMLSSVEVLSMTNEERSPIFEKHVGRIRTNIAHLRSILEDFLQLGKLDVKGVDLRITEIDFPVFFEEQIQDLRVASSPGQEIRLSCEGDLGTTRHSDNGLRVVLSNLVGNAVKYSPGGEPVEVAVKRSETGSDQRFSIRVSDRGIGIPDGDKAFLFERFFRASNAETIKGTGLGLHISRQYVEAMAGTIEVADNPAGRGTSFTVRLPYSLPD